MHTLPERILAWFGPAISQPAFEVGPEVREQFESLIMISKLKLKKEKE